MLRKLNDLIGYTIAASDEEIGRVDDFYFDERTWDIRYLVVDTGPWLFGRKVLISHESLGQPFWENETFPINLTKEQIENSPSIDLAKPVSRQEQTELHSHYEWPMYWLAASGAAGGSPIPVGGYNGVSPAVAVAPASIAAASATVEAETEAVTEHAESTEESAKSMLRSAKEVIGYHIAANDGDIGHVEDFFADDSEWHIHYMMIDTRNWLPGRKVLIAPKWTQSVNWSESKVHIDMTQQQVQESPEYNPTTQIERTYETALHTYYGYPGYWLY